MRDLKKILNPDDIQAIEATDDTNWIPKDPAEVILPYLEEASREIDPNNVEERIEWTKEVVDKYQELINQCKELEAQIESRCQAVKVPINRSIDMRLLEAMGRVFGFETEEITFEQYKICIQELALLNNNTIPNPGV